MGSNPTADSFAWTNALVRPRRYEVPAAEHLTFCWWWRLGGRRAAYPFGGFLEMACELRWGLVAAF